MELFQVRILEWVAFPFSRDFRDPGIEPRSPTLQADSYHLSHQGSPESNQLYSKFLISTSISPKIAREQASVHNSLFSTLQNKGGQESLACFSAWGSQKAGTDLATEHQPFTHAKIFYIAHCPKEKSSFAE